MGEINEFHHFDTVSDFSDHSFGRDDVSDHSHSNCICNRAIMREWKILQLNLPESIYVRVYEERIDLMRAVIIGAAGTPYHDGLFFFDIKFPFNYPNVPPKLSYHSFGLRLNPNMYHDGFVCLSLLNTWPGKNTEMWDPQRSTILQLLVSIQGLVLNEKPFFNEPDSEGSGFGRRFLNERKSRVCNETAFTLTLQTSFHHLSTPPVNFQDFVKAHFRERGSMILDACDDYVTRRVRVGYYSCRLRSSWSREHVSLEFVESVREFYPLLLHQFRQCGAPLTLDRKLGQSKKKNAAQRHNSKTKHSGIFNKVTKKIKQVFRWKKFKFGTRKSDGSLQSA